MPGLADRSVIPDDELEHYERAMNRVRMSTEGNPNADARPRVDGKPYAYDYWRVWTHAPPLLAAHLEGSRALLTVQGKPGHFSHEDHEMIDLVLGFDSGYWGFHGGHTANAVSAGVRIEAMKALAEGREEDLTEDEAFQVAFIRAVRDGKMTDDLWAKAVERQGTVRGVIEFAYFVCRQFTTHRMMWATGCPAIDIDDWYAALDSYEDGSADLAAATGYYLQPNYTPGERVD
jgi:hypothetical protein